MDRKQEIIQGWRRYYWLRHGMEPDLSADISKAVNDHQGFKLVSDPECWHGSWIGKYAGFKLSSLDPKGLMHRLSFWGDDDFGMTKDSKNLNELEELLARIPDTVSVDLLEFLGFEVF